MNKITDYKLIISSALGQFLMYIFGLILLFAVLIPAGFEIDNTDTIVNLEFFRDNMVASYLLNVGIYLVTGLLQIILSIGMFRILKSKEQSILNQSALAIGLVWSGCLLAYAMISSIAIDTATKLLETDPAQAETLWNSVDVVLSGIGGGTEFIGGLWVFLVSVIILSTKKMPTSLGLIGVIAGLGGIVSIVPIFIEAINIFALGMLVWFISTGIYLIRNKSQLS